MAIFLSFNSDKRFFESRFAGSLDLQTILDAYKEFFRKQFNADTAGLTLREFVDLSDMEFSSIPTAGVRDIAEVYLELCDEFGLAGVKLAIFAPSDITFGMGRVFASRADDDRIETMVFRDREQAEQYLAG